MRREEATVLIRGRLKKVTCSVLALYTSILKSEGGSWALKRDGKGKREGKRKPEKSPVT